MCECRGWLFCLSSTAAGLSAAPQGALKASGWHHFSVIHLQITDIQARVAMALASLARLPVSTPPQTRGTQCANVDDQAFTIR